jgi:hypothetical protein
MWLEELGRCVVRKRMCFWCVWRAFDEGSSLGSLDVFDFLGEDEGSLAKVDVWRGRVGIL